MSETIDSLLVSLGLETDKKSFDDANSAFKGVTDNMLQLAASITAGFGFDKLTRQFAGFVSEIDRFSRRNIIDPNNVLRWGFAYEQMGGKVQDAMGAIEKFNNLRDKAKAGQIDEKALRQAGINPYDLINITNPHEAMMWTSKAMQGMNADQKRMFGQGMALTPVDQDVLSNGPQWVNQQFDDYNKRGQQITPEAIKIADDYNDALLKLTTNVNGLASELSGPLTESITALVKRADSWLVDNKQGIVEEFNEAIPLLELMAKGIGALVAIRVMEKGGRMFLKYLPIVGAAAYAEYLYDDRENIANSAKSSWDYNTRHAKRGVGDGLKWLGIENSWANRKQGDRSLDPLAPVASEPVQRGQSAHKPTASVRDMEQYRNDPNVLHYLDVIAKAEGTDKYPNSGYNTKFGGGQFSDNTDHPRELMPFKQTDGKNNLTSAAGRYQFTRQTWDSAANALGLTDFSPESQDLAAIYLINRRGQLDNVANGDFSSATAGLGNEWASLPSSRYAQPTRSPEEMESYYSRRNTPPEPQRHSGSASGTLTKITLAPVITINEAGDAEKTRSIVEECLGDACNELALSVRTNSQ
ncbi:glycoside hydrolase family 24 protein [Yersinia pekkanenii]|nr:glycoside hydrolase family 104 protein [Yersinia pekkanenii]